MGKALSITLPVVDRTRFQYNPLPAYPRRRTQGSTLLTGDEAIRRLTQAIEEDEAEVENTRSSSSKKRRRPVPESESETDQTSVSDSDDPREAAHWRKIVNTFLESKEGRLPSLATLSSPSVRIHRGDNRCFQCRLLPQRCNINNKTWICATAKLPGTARKCVSCYMIDRATNCLLPPSGESSESSNEDATDRSDPSENNTPIYRRRKKAEAYQGSEIASSSDEDSMHTSANSQFDFNPEREGSASEGASTGSAPSSLTGSSLFSTDSYDGHGGQTNRNHPGRKGLRQSYRTLRNWAHELRSEVGNPLSELADKIKAYEQSMDQ